MKNYYFTFGFDSPNRKGYVKIKAEGMEQAREKMVQDWGTGWAFQYAEEEFLPQINKYDLHEVPADEASH